MMPLFFRNRAILVLTGSCPAVLVLALTMAQTPAQDPPIPAPPIKLNRLIKESSPYLIQHAKNPVDWFSWGDEAFAKARKENKVVFLSIGYTACHWCHVMERESFSDAGVAKILNDHFVCIKVDREERPDIDHVYMSALAAQGTPGGWPLSMFLDPSGKPIFGGTYWPREDRILGGKPVSGFKTILARVVKLWAEDRVGLEKQAESLAQATTRVLGGTVLGRSIKEPGLEMVDKALAALEEGFDPEFGGFGDADRQFKGPKFPSPGSLLLWIHAIPRKPGSDYATKLERTLDQMGRGGIHDMVGGGFHRYTTERTWTVPHFEKMLYDNAMLLEVYSRAAKLGKSTSHRRTATNIVSFLKREMTDPEGGFYSSLDADSLNPAGHEEEGSFYVWTDEELKIAIPDKDERRILVRLLGATPGDPNFEGKYHILKQPKTPLEWSKELKIPEKEVHAALQSVSAKLLLKREKRARPYRDTKVLSGWNGLAIAGLATAGKQLELPVATEMAKQAAQFVLAKMRDSKGGLLHSWAAIPGEKPTARHAAFLEDYAYLIYGLLALHEATGEPGWLLESQKLADVMIERFEDGDLGGFFIAAPKENKLFAQAKDQYDGALPSGNSIAAICLVRLGKFPKGDKYSAAAKRTLQAFSGTLQSRPNSLPAMNIALFESGK